LAKDYQVEVECARLRLELGMHSKSTPRSQLKDHKKVLLKLKVICRATEKCRLSMRTSPKLFKSNRDQKVLEEGNHPAIIRKS